MSERKCPLCIFALAFSDARTAQRVALIQGAAKVDREQSRSLKCKLKSFEASACFRDIITLCIKSKIGLSCSLQRQRGARALSRQRQTQFGDGQVTVGILPPRALKSAFFYINGIAENVPKCSRGALTGRLSL